MSAPVLVGFAGVLVAAVATGMLAGRCVRQPRIGMIAWTGASLGLTIALAAQSMGFASGFGQVTFRAVQLTALLLVPLWLAWGLVELTVGNDAVRFGTRLVSAALAVVASVILATDPLSAQPFGKAWPLTSAHFQPISRSALDVVQAAAVLAALTCVGLVLAGRGSAAPPAAVIPSGLAVLMTAGLRFPLPAGVAYPLLSTAAAGLVWFGASRIGERNGRRDGVRDGDGRYRPDDDFWPDDARRPADGPPPASQYVTYGQRAGAPGPGRPGDFPGVRPGAGPQPPAPGPSSRQPQSSASVPAQPWPQASSGAGGPAAARHGPTAGSRSSPCSTTGPPSSTGSPRKRPSWSARASRTPWCTSSTSCRTPRCSGSSTRSTGTGPPSTATRTSRTCSVSWPSGGRSCSRPTSSSCGSSTPRSRRCRTRRRRRAAAPAAAPAAAADGRRSQCRRRAGRRGPGTAAAAGTRGCAPGPARAAVPPPARPQPPRPDQERYERPGYDQERYDQERYDQERYDQRRPDQRQVPSAGRRYGGG